MAATIRLFADNRYPWALEGEDGYGLAESKSFEGVAGRAHELGLEVQIAVSCGCCACDEQVQQGHFACLPPPRAMLELERAGKVVRSYNGAAWVWEAI